MDKNQFGLIEADFTDLDARTDAAASEIRDFELVLQGGGLGDTIL